MSENFVRWLCHKFTDIHPLAYCINNWNNSDSSIKSSPSLSLFKSNLNEFVRPKGNTFFSIRDSFGIKLLTKIRICFSDLRDHRFNHNFNCVTPTCSCGFDEETTVHFNLCCPRCILRTIYLCKIKSDVSVLPTDHLTHIPLYGSNTNASILIQTFERSDCS